VSLDVLALGYVGAGVLVLAIVATLRAVPSLGDGLLLVGLWPLWGPLLVVESRQRQPGDHERELLGALARAKASPLAQVLPDADTARVLAGRLREAGQRLDELEAVLARPDFDPVAAEARARELAGRGASAAAATAQLRVRTLAQLQTLRVRYRRELDEVHELIAQLVTQAELVRLQPAIAQSSSELVRELVARVEGLDELFTYQAALGDDAVEYAPPPGR